MNKLYTFIALFVFALSFNACVDQDFDEPDRNDLIPDVTHTIAQMMNSYPPDQFLEIDEDMVINGVVVSDDAAGNFFREIIIQDETGGILIRVDRTNLSAEYPPGRRVFIECRGLAVGNFAGLPQMGILGTDEDGEPTTDRIPDALVGEFITKGTIDNVITPKEVDAVNELTFADINTLVQLNNVEFTLDDVTTYANPGGSSSENQNLEFCNGDEVLVRNSDFASFAAEPLPTGSGNLVGVLGVFNSDFQVKIRDVFDTEGMTNPRCGACSGSEQLITIQELRDMFTGSAMDIEDPLRIVGIAISDRANSNSPDRNLVLQDASAGITARFVGNHAVNLGDEVEICLTGAELSEFRSLLQVTNLDLSKAQVIGSGSITPQTITLAEYGGNRRAYESELLLIENAMLSGGSTYSAAGTISDGTGSTEIFTYNTSTFANAPVPSEAGKITCVGSVFDDAQVFIRNTDDVEKHDGGGGGDPTQISIGEVRAAYGGATITYTGNHFITGIVVTDQGNGNTTDRNLAVQDGESGIIVRFAATHAFALNEMIEVEIQGQELSEFNGLMQVNNVPLENAKSLGAGTPPAPRVTTVNEILQNAEAWESTVVQVTNVMLTGASTYNGVNGVVTLTDASGSMDLYTRSQASFTNTALPSGAVKVTAIIGEFNTPQLSIRNLSDVE